MRNHFIDALTALAESNDNIYLMTGDLGFGVLDNYISKLPDRYINVGISEQNMASVAAGFALEGNIVYIYSIGNFPTMRCLEQIRNDICYNNANVKIISVGGGLAYGQLGMSHHATEDIAIMRALPNMKVFVPADIPEAVAILEYVNHCDGPCYIRLEKNVKEQYNNDINDIALLQTIIAKGDINILATGTIISEAVKAAQSLNKVGYNVGVFSVPTIKPIDTKSIKQLAKESRVIISLEEHNVIGGLGSAIAEIIAEMSSPKSKLIRIGIEDSYTTIVGSQQYLRHQLRIDNEAIELKIKEVV